MKNKYNIPDLLTGLIGHRGLPFPGAYYGDSKRQPDVKGTRLYAADKLGRWYFMPVSIKHPRIATAGNTIELEYAVLNVTGQKKIVETPLVGQKGAVKEMISVSDYKISVTAFICSDDGSYPAEKISRMKDLYKINEAVELISAFTDLILEEDDMVVITDIAFPPTPGVEDGQAVTLTLVTDKPFELIID